MNFQVFFCITLLVVAVLSSSPESGLDFLVLDQMIQLDAELTEDCFENLLYKTNESKCIREAVRDLVRQCVEAGVDSLDPLVRKTSAVKLTICEFENTGIAYPNNCQNIEDSQEIGNCISSLEKSPQHWTTFSGNYRETFQICYSESLPFAKDQIIHVFYNITKIYSKLQQDFLNANKFSDQVMHSIKRELHKLYDLTERLMSQQEFNKAHMQTDFQNFNDEIKQDISDTLAFFKGFSEVAKYKTETSLHDIDYVKDQINLLAQNFDDQNFQNRIKAIKTEILLELGQVELEATNVFARIMSSLEENGIVTSQSVKLSEELRSSLKLSTLETMNLQQAIIKSADTLSSQRQEFQDEFQHTFHELSEMTNDLAISLTDNFEVSFDVFENRFDILVKKLNGTFNQIDILNEKIQNVTSQFGLISFPRFPQFSLLLPPISSIIQTMTHQLGSKITSFIKIALSIVALTTVLVFSLFSSIVFNFLKKAQEIGRLIATFVKIILSMVLGIRLAIVLSRYFQNTYG